MTARRGPFLHLVTHRRLVAPEARTARAEVKALEAWIARALEAHVDVVQVREPDLDAALLLALVSSVRALARGTPTRIVVNDRADVALAARAHGVHLRGDGPDVARVRRLRGGPWIVGRSVHTPREVRAHQAADYLYFGTVFPSATKGVGSAAQGALALARAVSMSRTPVIAIGGITLATARIALATGAAGVAAIGLFLPRGRTPDALGPARGVTALRAALSSAGGPGL